MGVGHEGTERILPLSWGKGNKHLSREIEKRLCFNILSLAALPASPSLLNSNRPYGCVYKERMCGLEKVGQKYKSELEESKSYFLFLLHYQTAFQPKFCKPNLEHIQDLNYGRALTPVREEKYFIFCLPV